MAGMDLVEAEGSKNTAGGEGWLSRYSEEVKLWMGSGKGGIFYSPGAEKS